MRTLFASALEHELAGRLFCKGLAFVYLVAFTSLAVQIDGLAAPDGILPFTHYLQRAFAIDGVLAFARVPTLFWFNASAMALQGVAVAGAAIAVLLLAGIGRQMVLLCLLFVLHLSLYQAGQIFTSFQWDYLLLECGFLAIVFAAAPTRLGVLLFHVLLFRLRFESGFFKLASGDPRWRDLSALDYYFETQPLPHAGSWYAHQLPHALLQSGVAFTLLAELVVPFFIFLPRPWRIGAALITILAQLLIIATSNHNFINLLTILLCLFVLDDRALGRMLPARFAERIVRGGHVRPPPGPAKTFSAICAVLVLALSVATLLAAQGRGSPARPIHAFAAIAPAFGIGNVFHLFPTMQTERQELRIFGSADGATWHEYELRFKPGALDRAPAFVAPHQPRLDWMMWFVPPQSPRTDYWFAPFLQGLRENRLSVTALVARNPFAGKPPPQFMRVLAYRYRFTTAQERAQTGNWWYAELLGEYPNVPPRNP